VRGSSRPAPSARQPAPAASASASASAEAAAPEKKEYVPSSLPLAERYALARSVGEECIQESELMNLLEKKPFPVCYDGFEPSGRMHIAQGILKAINVNKLTRAGCVFKFWVADWFALMNNKLGGNIKNIRMVGEYMIEVWRAAGMDMSNVEFLWASDEINAHPDEYWSIVLDIARRNKLPRIARCCTIMGRAETDELSAAQIMYPCMQCADIFFLKADICQLGMDQRKVNMLAREYCDDIKRKLKPVILSHHMLMGLKEGQEKMSKSDPNSAIFMEDDAKTVVSKINKAFCPEKVVEGNPVLNWTKHIIFGKFDTWTVNRPDSDGGDVTYDSYEALEADFVSGGLHPKALKAALAATLNALIEPVRKHFATDKRAMDILKRVRALKVTR
jgi:tyrosyl-tRNA synthetase